ncbi:MAG: hypothetical protein KIT84_29090 [Labilithrix sp.]|nr:hypothetical protein [Labilithrix sp.]MCW5815117.1 hypothetical protein [Labilithrix sp.]
MALLSACGGARKNAPAPQTGEATLTAAQLEGGGLEKILVTEKGSIAIVERDGCMAMVRETPTPSGPVDEIQTRCAKPERMQKWFEGADKVASKMALEPMKVPERPALRHHGRGHTLDEGDESAQAIVDPRGPATAKVLTANGRLMRVTKDADVTRMNAEVRAFADELAGAEKVAPGPASANGWQMLHVSGPARVMFAGTPTRGTLDARVSTNGQYLCEFTTVFGGDSPVRATKSGWLKPASAARAIDVVLGPWSAPTAAVPPRTAFAAGMKGGTEQRSSPAATAAVFELFGEVQEALGDACLPELEPPTAGALGL